MAGLLVSYDWPIIPVVPVSCHGLLGVVGFVGVKMYRDVVAF